VLTLGFILLHHLNYIQVACALLVMQPWLQGHLLCH